MFAEADLIQRLGDALSTRMLFLPRATGEIKAETDVAEVELVPSLGDAHRPNGALHVG